MDAREELVLRLSLKRRRKLGTLSEGGYQELEMAVRTNPADFVDDSQEEAFLEVVHALDVYDESQKDDDLLDDQQFERARTKRLEQLHASCQKALAIDPSSTDARLLHTLSADLNPDETLDRLLDQRRREHEAEGAIKVPVTGDAWSDVFSRPRLRLEDAIARTCMDSARYRMALRYSSDLLAVAPLDHQGARFTCALAMARLEDEDGLEWLDQRFSRKGNAWLHLARVLLLYKLDRLPAARRALKGFDRLQEGGAYALLQPVFVDTYMPDRPAFDAGSFREAMLAVHEADPIIADTPDFAPWAAEQPSFVASARRFAEDNGFDWRDPEE